MSSTKNVGSNKHPPSKDDQRIIVGVRMRSPSTESTSTTTAPSNKPSIWRPLPTYNAVTQTSPKGRPLKDRVLGQTFFTFDRVFPTDTTIDNDGTGIVDALGVNNNNLVVAYGAPQSGKTHTLLHNNGAILSSMFGNGDTTTSVQVSHIEIYNGQVRSLLSSESSVASTPHEVMELYTRGESNRMTAGTSGSSSRSHSIFTVCRDDGKTTTLVDIGTNVPQESMESVNTSLLAVARSIQSGLSAAEKENNTPKSLLSSQLLLQPASQLVLICCADPTSLQETRATFQFASQIVALRDNNKSSTVLQALRAESFLNRTALEQKENQLVSVKENMLQMQCPLASNKRRRRLSLCGHNDCNTPPQKMVRRTDCAPHSDPEHKARRPAVTASLSPVSELALVREAHAVQQKMVIAAAKFHAEQHTSLLEEKNQEIVALKKNALKNFAGDDIRLSSGQQAFTPQRLGNYTATTAVAPGTEPGRDKKFLSPNSELSLVRQAHIIQKQRAGQQVSHYKEERNASLSLCETMSSSLKTLQEEYDGKEVALANATARFEELKADLVTSLTSEENAIQEQSRLSETLAKAQQDTALLKDTVATMATEKDSLKMQNADLSNALKKKAEEAEMMKTQQQQALEKALADNSNAFSNQLVTLEGKFASLTSEKSGLDRHNAELKEELNAKSRELESMKASVKEQLEQASSSSEQQLAERERLLTKSQKEVEDLERFLTEAVHDKADLSEIVDAMRNDLDIMRPKLAELERGLEEERAAHAALQRSYSTMVQEKKEIELEQSRLNQALAKANTRRDELVQEMASLKADRDTKIQDVNNDAKATRSQLEQATTKIADLERQLQKSKEVEGQVNREMDEFQAFHENSVNTLEKEIESKENEVAVLQKDVQEKNELITLLENRGVNSHEDTASLQMELEQAKEDANNLQVDLVASKEEMNSLQQRLVELKSEKESVVQQLESFTKRCTDLEASVASHAAEVEAMESLSKLKSEIELGLSSAQSNLQERDNQIASLQSQLKDAAQEKSDLVSSLEESKANALAEPQRLHLELQQSTENNERLQSNLAALTKEKGELQQKISEMRFEKEHLTQQLEESTKKCIDLEGRVVSLEKEIESLNAKSESHAEGTNVGDTEAIISEKDQEIAYLKDKAKKMKKESKSKDKLIAKLEGLKMTKEQLKTLKKIKDERNQFFHESEELRAKLREVLAENDKLRSVGATCEPKRRRAELSPEDDKENVTTNEITIKKQKHSSDSNEPAKKSKKGDANKAFGGEIKANDMAIR